MSRDGQNVVPGLGRQIAVADEPVRDTGSTGIVGGGGQSKITETLLEVGEKFGGFWYCFFGIERIGKATLISRLRHELRDALRAGWTDCVGSKAAFLPYQPCQERDRQTLSSGRRFNKAADGCFDGFNLAGSAMSLRANEGLLIEQA